MTVKSHILPPHKKLSFFTTAAALALVAASPVFAAGETLSKSEITEKFSAVSATQQVQLDNAAYGEILATYISTSATGITGFDYKGVSADDNAKLDAYIDTLEAVVPSQLTRDQQIAYWSNLYNAVTLDVVLDHSQVDSIKDIELESEEKKGFFASLASAFGGGPWDAPLVVVDGVSLTLNNIEHEILRKMDEPRIHYAINCASYSCPNLRIEPWTAPNLSAELDEAAVEYVNHPRGVSVASDGDVTVSKIYRWFQEDFGDSEAGVLAHLRPYAQGELKTALEQAESIRRFKYDWTINSPEEVAKLEPQS
jgi:hypothetical protein